MTLRQTAYEVQVTEYERGWGQRPDGRLLFHTKEDAQRIIGEEYAKRSRTTYVPDIYEDYSEPRLVEISDEVARRMVNKTYIWER